MATYHPATNARSEAIKARLVDLWPQSIIMFGVALTVIWAGGLVYMLVKLLAMI
jgi:hypothetical protein